MTVIRSYSPNGLIRPDPDYNLCCGLFHATTAAKFFSIVFLCLCFVVSILNFGLFGFDKEWISMFCIFYTFYCSLLTYGVFLEKSIFLVPFLFIHGLTTALLGSLIVIVCLFGSATDMVSQHHVDNIHLRDLYRMHYLDPDDKKTQAIVSAIALATGVLSCIVCMYSWYAVNQTYKCFKEAKRTMLPGFQIGIVASNEKINNENLIL